MSNPSSGSINGTKLTRTNPSGHDSSGWATSKGGKVGTGNDAPRSGTAPTPRTLGPRSA